MANCQAARAGARIAPALVVALILACGAPKYHYVKNSDAATYVRVPSEWTLFEEDELFAGAQGSKDAQAQFKELSWSVAFDAAPKPSLRHVLSGADHPTGLVQVRTLLPEQRGAFSMAELRSLLLRFDPLSPEVREGNDVEILHSRTIKREGGIRGSDLLLNLTTAEGDVVRWRQIALTDDSFSRVHVLAVSCDTRCYDANRGVIDNVVASWKVKES